MSSEITTLVEIILSAIFGTGGLCAFIITLVKLSKRSKTYEVRCKLASEFIKKDVVKVQPEQAKQLITDILDGKIDSKNGIAKVVKDLSKKK